MAGLRSGSVSLNDAQPHISTLAFGGVGESGFGAYRGRSSFDIFVHRRPYTNTPSWMEALLEIRYPPYSAWKLKLFTMIFEGTPDFDRAGHQSISKWLKHILWRMPNLTIPGAAAIAISE
jgi:beta-apo-4'-carotenal oxygenase